MDIQRLIHLAKCSLGEEGAPIPVEDARLVLLMKQLEEVEAERRAQPASVPAAGGMFNQLDVSGTTGKFRALTARRQG